MQILALILFKLLARIFFYIIYLAIYCHGNFYLYILKLLHSFYYVDFISPFLTRKCEISHESTRCISILFYTNKHDKIKITCVILENIHKEF